MSPTPKITRFIETSEAGSPVRLRSRHAGETPQILDPSLRSGFRQRAPASLTPAKRLNLRLSNPHVLLTPEAMKMVGSARSTLLLFSKIVPAYAGPPERHFRSKERLRNQHTSALAHQRLFSHRRNWASVRAAPADCDEQ